MIGGGPPAGAARRTGWSGSARSPPTRATARSPARWPGSCRSSTRWWTAAASAALARLPGRIAEAERRPRARGVARVQGGGGMTGIVDGHHHIWRQADLPWLQGPMVPRIFGPYEPIRRDYPIEEYLADLAGTGVEKSVYVQTQLGEVRAPSTRSPGCRRRPTRTAGRTPSSAMPTCSTTSVGEVLARQAAFPLMRGVRMQLHWHENPQYRFAPRPDLMDDAAFRRNLRRLADYGWSFDLQVFAPQMAGRGAAGGGQPRHHLRAAALRHAGGPDRARAGAAWREGMRASGGPAERRQQALRARHLHPPQRPGARRRHRRRDRRRCSGRSAASSAATFRSRSSGRAMRSSLRPSGRRWRIWRRRSSGRC